MLVVRGFQGLGLKVLGCAVTIGNFDGVHLGHQVVIKGAVHEAMKLGAPSVVCTFDPHTRVVVGPHRPPQPLQSTEQRINIFRTLGVDIVVVIPFDEEVATVSHNHFVEDFLRGELGCRHVHVSAGFAFGRDGAGNADFLKEVGTDAGFETTVVPALELDGEPVSSTRIRGALRDGRIDIANRLLGRPFALEGKVVQGAGRGSGLDVPTANLETSGHCLPACGVYVTESTIAGTTYRSISNVGVRPTFERRSCPIVESHLLDKTLSLYGAHMRLDFLHRLRGERRFDQPAELIAQINKDIEQARSYFGRCPSP